jgi:hypothetical protein
VTPREAFLEGLAKSDRIAASQREDQRHVVKMENRAAGVAKLVRTLKAKRL